jgi:putative addiction module component (TIGR02574 family)
MTAIGKIDLDKILALPAEDKLAIADAIWSSLEQSSGDVPLTEPQKRALAQRVAEDDDDDTDGETWEQFKQRVDAM